jgi:hypothetical protein
MDFAQSDLKENQPRIRRSVWSKLMNKLET